MNYRTSYSVIIKCKKCGTIQRCEVNHSEDVSFFNKVCNQCGVFIFDINDTEEIDEEVHDRIKTLLAERVYYKTYLIALREIKKDLWYQFNHYAKLKNQKYTIKMTLGKLQSRSDEAKEWIRQRSRELESLGFNSGGQI